MRVFSNSKSSSKFIRHYLFGLLKSYSVLAKSVQTVLPIDSTLTKSGDYWFLALLRILPLPRKLELKVR